MAFEKLKIYLMFVKYVIPYRFKCFVEYWSALFHKWTYRQSDSAQNILIIGGSFTGVQLAKRLSETVPTGFKVMLLERNSHFNYSFNFPRYSVRQNNEWKAFIPYDNIAPRAPTGAFERIHDEAETVSKDVVTLKSGRQLPYSYLVLATGSWQPSPSKLISTDREEECSELRELQKCVETAQTVAVVGGGAVGVELATDIMSYYPKKEVTLVHSRDQLLNRWDRKLHDHVMEAMDHLRVNTILGKRPKVCLTGEGKAGRLEFPDGQVEEYDVVIPCTGQKPNSSIVETLEPSLISNETGRILVQRTLQVAGKDESLNHVFAIGDVAETGGAKMARSAWLQSEVILKNIYSTIKGRKATAVYTPNNEIEGALKLTLGKDRCVVYSERNDGTTMLVPGPGGSEDLEAERAWKNYGVDLNDYSG